jgi:hypothetical protein
MVIEVQIDEAATRLRELIVQLGPDDEVLLMDKSLPLASISRPAATTQPQAQNSAHDQWHARLKALGTRYQPTGIPVSISRESFYEE